MRRFELAEPQTLEQACALLSDDGDAKALAGYLDPDVVLFTPWGEYRGREAMLAYVSKRYFSLSPLPHMEMKMKSLRILGNAAWYDYDYSVTLGETRIEGRGTGVAEDVLNLAGAKRLVDVDGHSPRPQGPEEGRRGFRAAFQEDRDAIPRPDALGDQAPCNDGRLTGQLTVRRDLIANQDGRVVGAVPRPLEQEAREIGCEYRHCAVHGSPAGVMPRSQSVDARHARAPYAGVLRRRNNDSLSCVHGR